jgi:cytochrome c
VGHGSVGQGEVIFAQQCASCHGAKGEGGVGDRLVGGRGTLASAKPIKTIGSYWPYAPTLFDYIRRAMPQNAPQSLSPDDVYAVSAYLLYLNELLPADAVLDATALSAIKMPNRGMFVDDPRPDVKNVACVTGCPGGK